MHYTQDEPPTTRKPWTGPSIVHHSDAPYDTHEVPAALRKPWRANPTVKRERGYNVKPYYNDFPTQNAFYTQPGNPLSPIFEENSSDRAGAQLMGSSAIMRGPGATLSKWEKFQLQREALNAKEKAASSSSSSSPKA